MIYYIALFLSIALNAASLIMLKRFALVGVKSELPMTGRERCRALVMRIFHPLLLISVVFYGIAALLWLVALLKVDLMVAYPSLSVTYVLIALISTGLFNEQITSRRWAGMALIVAGVIVMNIG